MTPKTNSLNRSLFLYFVIIAIVVVALISLAYEDILTTKEIAGFLLATLGTFLGAFFAFRLNEHKDKDKIIREQKKALNRALFILGRQQNVLLLLNEHLSLFKNEFERTFNLPALSLPSYPDLIQNFQELDFLFESSQPNILMMLAIEQERFYQTMESIRIRNTFYVNEVLPEIHRLELNHKELTLSQISKVLGEKIFGEAINGTRSLYFHVEQGNKSISELLETLFKLAKEIFPDERFPKFERDPNLSAIPKVDIYRS